MTCTGFSHDGKYVATADMGGLVQVWLTSSGEKVWSFETGDVEVNMYNSTIIPCSLNVFTGRNIFCV